MLLTDAKLVNNPLFASFFYLYFQSWLVFISKVGWISFPKLAGFYFQSWQKKDLPDPACPITAGAVGVIMTVGALSTGNYTVIGISDVVLMNGSSVDTEFWLISGMPKLSDLKILDQGYVGYEARVLGIAKYSLTIGDNQSSSLNVDLQPAGALVYGIVWHAGGWSIGGVAVNDWRLYGNKSTEGLSFDDSGN